MPAWNDLLDALEALPDDKKSAWISSAINDALVGISDLRDGRNVIIYASAFLQKPLAVPAPWLQITGEEINGFMSVMYGMDWSKGLTLILHTPGGVTNATETIVEYLWSKFNEFEVIIPTFAMSAGTMISLASDCLVMGRQSQLGPIDPQMPFGGRSISARAVVDQFERAKQEILTNQAAAHVWLPILQTIGPSLLQEADNALQYGEKMVAGWLEKRMFANATDPHAKAKAVAQHFNDASAHKSHGRRIDREEARSCGLIVEDLEDDQQLQEHVLTAYHLVTLTFEKSAVTKMLASHHKRTWLKNWSQPVQVPPP